jgi:hypothetical protein
VSVSIETIVFCDDCGEQNSGDDRALNAKEIRKKRREWGWIQVGKRDYCGDCAKKIKDAKP